MDDDAMASRQTECRSQTNGELLKPVGSRSNSYEEPLRDCGLPNVVASVSQRQQQEDMAAWLAGGAVRQE